MTYRYRVRFDAWEGALLAALGLATSSACGGNSTVKGGASGEAGEGASGGTSGGSGGAGATGGSTGGHAGSGAVSGKGGTSGRGGTGGTGGGAEGGSGAQGGSAQGGSGADGGNSAQGGAGAPGGSGGTVSTNPFPCVNPMPVLDASSGYVRCDDGSIHREAQNDCPTDVPRAEGMPNYDPARDECEYDADCTTPNSYCGQQTIEGGRVAGYTCIGGCVRDADCAADQICFCGDPIGECVSATCTTDADCGDGLECVNHDPSQGCGLVAFACQTQEDACRATCASNMCSLSEAGVRECAPGGCAIGRPFLVGGEARTAELVVTNAWRDPGVAPAVPALLASERAALAKHWSDAGLAEHASVAAFARFALEAMALGAPPTLLSDTTRAMQDELEHARLCFGIASAYGAQAIGPGALPMHAVLGEVTLASASLSALVEGCIGETLAAIEASESASHATDPVIAALLSRIAEDEGRHAELAFRFVAWALTLGGEELARPLRARLASERRAFAAESQSTPDDALLEHGVLAGARRAALRQHAFERVVAPCLERLLAEGPEPSSRAPSERIAQARA